MRTAASASTIEQPQLRLGRRAVLLRFRHEALGLVDLALFGEHPCELRLRLRELAVLAERSEQPDRLAHELLRPRELALLEGDVGHAGQREREQRRVTDLGEELAGQLVGRLGRVELLPHAMEPAQSEHRLASRARTSALVGQLDRLVDQTLGLVELEPDDVRLGQRLRGDGLEILAAGGERDCERLLHVRHGLGHRSSRDADADSDHERVEVRVDVRLVLLQLERAVDELLRARGVSGLPQRRVAERGQRQRFHQRRRPQPPPPHEPSPSPPATAVRSPSLQTARAA